MIKPHSAFVDTENIRLHYLEWDPEQLRKREQWVWGGQVSNEHDDNIPLVMLHGLGATAETWLLVAEHLCKQHLIVAFDLRGHGQSDQPEDGYDLVTIAEDIIRGMAVLGLGKVGLVGHGWGARIALIMAARHPALISHLMLVDCPHVEPRHWPGMTRERFIRGKGSNTTYDSLASFLDMMQKEMSSFWSPAVEAVVQTYVQVLPDGSVEERPRPEYQRQIRESLWDDRALPYYSKLACPVLLIPAASQPQPGDVPPERLEKAGEFAATKGYMALQVARAIQRCRVLWMPDTSHDIQLQRPKGLADAIANFTRE